MTLASGKRVGDTIRLPYGFWRQGDGGRLLRDAALSNRMVADRLGVSLTQVITARWHVAHPVKVRPPLSQWRAGQKPARAPRLSDRPCAREGCRKMVGRTALRFNPAETFCSRVCSNTVRGVEEVDPARIMGTGVLSGAKGDTLILHDREARLPWNRIHVPRRG